MKSTKALTRELARVDAARLPGWGLTGLLKSWLETTGAMAQGRSHRRSCIRNLSSESFFDLLFHSRSLIIPLPFSV